MAKKAGSGSAKDMRAKRAAAADPTRLRIYSCFYFRDRWTAKELAEELGVKANGLYYHLRLMEEAGFLKVVDTRASGRMVERVYGRGEPEDQVVRWEARQPVEMAMHLGAIVESGRADAEQVLYRRAEQLEAGERAAFVNCASPAITTTPEEVLLFNDRIQKLIKEFRERATNRARDRRGSRKPGTVWLSFTYLLFEQEIESRMRERALSDVEATA